VGRKNLFGPDRICAVVAASTAKQMAQQLRLTLRQTRTVELRLDWLKDKGEIIRLLSWLRAHRLRATLIATCRRRVAGGRFSGPVEDQLAVLMVAAAAGCAWCDVEVESAEELRRGRLRSFFGEKRVLVSWHDFRAAPRQLQSVLKRLSRNSGDAVKIATQCNSIRDSVRVLAVARGRRNVVAVPMGEAGLPARVLALREGSALAYASVGEATAPGQVSLEEMKQLYRADQLDRRTRVYGVIGNPVSHSLSPLLHNTGFIARRMNAVYLPFLVKELRDFLFAIEPMGIAGFSVTLPHKEAILRHLDDCDPLAEAIGAVNTVVVRGGGKLYGYNTDYVGVLRALEKRVALRGSRVLVLGAGGAAWATALALARAGAIVAICARRKAKARELARAVRGEVIQWESPRSEFFDAIVNATPVGMFPFVRDSLLRAAELNCRVVMDLVYRPMKTELLRRAERRGIETVSGVEMFLAQGIAQWEIWSGLRAPEAAMRRAVLAALRRDERRRGAA